MSAARTLLIKLGAPARLLRHIELVGEAADRLLEKLAELRVPLDADLVRVGVVVHDAGKILYPEELDRPGGLHEAAGEALLLTNGASPEVARFCVSHASWATGERSLEELVVALADKLWKGVRRADLEETVIDVVAANMSMDRWRMFVELDSLFEEIAAAGPARLDRSRG